MGFQDLMELAARNSAEQHAKLADKERERKLAERKAELDRARKQAEEQARFEERRRERQEREAKLREAKEKELASLPPTRNLYALKQERIKRGLDPNGTEDHLMSKADKQASSSYSDLMKKAAENAKAVLLGKPAAQSSQKDRDLPMTREERQAKSRKALFQDDGIGIGSMALAKMKSGPTGASGSRRSESPFDKGHSSSAALVRTKSLPEPVRTASTRPSSSAPSSRAAQTKSFSTSAQSLSARDRLKAGFAPNQLRKLNTEKRDLRTIEEIEADLKRKKMAGNGRSTDSPPPAKKTASGAVRPPAVKRKPDEVTRNTVPAKRSRAEPASSDTGSESEDDGRDRHRRSRPKAAIGSGLDNSMRDEIWKLLGRDRNRDIQRDAWSDDDVMEATEADMRREEERAARLARKEDKAEEERLRRRAEEKAKAKAKAKAK